MGKEQILVREKPMMKNMGNSKIKEGVIDAPGQFQRKKWPFYWISRTDGLYMKALETELKKSGLDIPSWRVLMLLNDGRARSISHLSTESVIKLNTMTRIIQRMKSDGLVNVRPSESDARVTEAYLTEAGEKSSRVALKHAKKVIKKTFDGISQRDIKILNSTLSKVMNNLEE